MSNKENFTFQSVPAASSTGRSGQSGQVSISEKLLEQLVAALVPKPFRKRHPIIFWGGIILLILFIVSAFMPESGVLEEDRIAVVRVEGPIMDIKDTLEWISKVSKDDSVKGVLLRIDSPGGGVAASQELYTALFDLGVHKPVVASMGSVAASGGLMVSMAAQHIVANPSTTTGSIGVIYSIPQLYELMQKIGVGQLNLTTGLFKDSGNPTRPMTPEERLYLEGVIDDMYEQFILLIAEGRKMPVDKIRPIADGRIFTGRAAKDYGLVDELGGQDAALAVLYKLTNVSEDTELYELEKPDEYLRELGLKVLGIDLGWKAFTPSFLYQ